MKKLILLFFVTTLFSCNIRFISADKYPFNSPSGKNKVSIKYSKDGTDSLRIKTAKESFVTAIPNNKIRFEIICKTTEDVILRSFDKEKVLIFVIKTKKWFEQKDYLKKCVETSS